ncbi:MAG: MBL fold metallo-hydrolase [Planctomycetes bacterium]|jgi:metal-dependent hydrolase (beta-lactamase superfamily II)|nr:MBL fold metallo-hydrolase [Phycisphaerae bacterium]NBB94850.1 MBL fold metallo-hydrolase [Planctomycetota bacterium]
MSRATITVLVDETAGRRGLLAEHGLAFWLALPEGSVLFDTGQGMALRHNAGRLDLDLASVDAVVLSHGHYDHTGHLADALDVACRVTARALVRRPHLATAFPHAISPCRVATLVETVTRPGS